MYCSVNFHKIDTHQISSILIKKAPTFSGTTPYSYFLCHRLILPIFILYIIRIIEYANFWVCLWLLTL